jgi:hypothetical protein
LFNYQMMSIENEICFFFSQFYIMRLMTDMGVVWLQNVQMVQRKGLQRRVHHYRYQCVVCK